MCPIADRAVSESPIRTVQEAKSGSLNILRSSCCAAASSALLLPAFLFQRLGITESRFIQQFLHPLTIRDRFRNLRHQIVWNVYRKAFAPEPSIQGVTGMALSTGAGRTVLSNARTLPQGQRSGNGGGELVDGALEPPSHLFGSFCHVCVSTNTRTSYALMNQFSMLLFAGRPCTQRPFDASIFCAPGQTMLPRHAPKTFSVTFKRT